MQRKINHKISVLIFTFCMAATLFFCPNNTYAADPLPGNASSLWTGPRLHGPTFPDGSSNAKRICRYYLDVTFSDDVNVMTLNFGTTDYYKSILEYDFITISGNRVIVDFVFFNDAYSRAFGFIGSSGDILSSSSYTIHTYGITEVSSGELAYTPMYIYDVGLIGDTWVNNVTTYETSVSSDVSTTSVLSDAVLSTSSGSALTDASLFKLNSNVLGSASLYLTESTGSFLTYVSGYTDFNGNFQLSTSSGSALTGVDATLNTNSATVVSDVSLTKSSSGFLTGASIYKGSSDVVSDVDILSASLPHSNIVITGTLDSYSRVSTIDSLSVSGVDIPGGGYYFFSNPEAPSSLSFKPSNGTLTTFPGRYLYFDYIFGIEDSVSDVSLSGNSNIEILSWSHSGDQLLVSCRYPAGEDDVEIDLSSITLDISFSDPDLLMKLLYFYVSSYDHSEAVEQAFSVKFFDMVKQGFAKVSNGLSSIVSGIVSSIEEQTDSLEYGYENETTTEATETGDSFTSVTDDYLETETAINDQVTPYLETYAPDSSGFLSFTSSFGIISGIITNIYNNLGDLQILFTFSMTIGVCLFLLQLKR